MLRACTRLALQLSNRSSSSKCANPLLSQRLRAATMPSSSSKSPRRATPKKQPAPVIPDPVLLGKAAKIAAQLQQLYPQPAIPLSHASPFQLLVAVMLSAQTTDKKVGWWGDAYHLGVPTLCTRVVQGGFAASGLPGGPPSETSGCFPVPLPWWPLKSSGSPGPSAVTCPGATKVPTTRVHT